MWGKKTQNKQELDLSAEIITNRRKINLLEIEIEKVRSSLKRFQGKLNYHIREEEEEEIQEEETEKDLNDEPFKSLW